MVAPIAARPQRGMIMAMPMIVRAVVMVMQGYLSTDQGQGLMGHEGSGEGEKGGQARGCGRCGFRFGRVGGGLGSGAVMAMAAGFG